MSCGHMPDSKWSKEKDVLRKVQIHFGFQQKILASIRHDAADENINPSDVVRKLIDLPYKRIQRARLGLSFNNEDLSSLAERYRLDGINEKEIKRRVMEEINIHYYKADAAKK